MVTIGRYWAATVDHLLLPGKLKRSLNSFKYIISFQMAPGPVNTLNRLYIIINVSKNTYKPWLIVGKIHGLSFGHVPPVQASINPYHILPVLIRSIHGSHPSSIPWNSHETTSYTASTVKAVHAIKSGVWPSPFSPGYLLVFPGYIGSLGRDHPWSNTITWSFPTPMKLPFHAPLPLRLSWP